MSFYNETHAGGSLEHLLDALGALRRSTRDWFALQQLKATLREERKQLASFSAQQLHDLGLTREQALAEAARTDLPRHRVEAVLSQSR
jgi:uncharacterized protein YjiS (DUF1127 family)